MDPQVNDANTTASSTVNAVELPTGVSTPSGANPEPKGDSNGDVPFHQHPRFQELIQKNRELIQKVELLENDSVRNKNASESDMVFRNAVTELKAMGVEEAAALKLISVLSTVANVTTQRNIAPLMEKTSATSMTVAVDNFKRNHSDYDGLKDDMARVFQGLDGRTQQLFAENVAEGLDLLYSKAKTAKIAELEKIAIDKGKNEAYVTKQDKTSISSSKGSVPVTTDITEFRKAISSMSNEDYLKDKKAIDKRYEDIIFGK